MAAQEAAAVAKAALERQLHAINKELSEARAAVGARQVYLCTLVFLTQVLRCGWAATTHHPFDSSPVPLLLLIPHTSSSHHARRLQPIEARWRVWPHLLQLSGRRLPRCAAR